MLGRVFPINRACIRCRQLKIKCVRGVGGDEQCQRCINAKQKCSFVDDSRFSGSSLSIAVPDSPPNSSSEPPLFSKDKKFHPTFQQSEEMLSTPPLTSLDGNLINPILLNPTPSMPNVNAHSSPVRHPSMQIGSDVALVDSEKVNLMSHTVFGAQDALDHITALETQIENTLSAFSLIGRSALLVGFDESAVAHGWGLLQRVYLVSSIEPDNCIDLCLQLGGHFSPYPGTVITPTQSLPTPVYKGDGSYFTQNELIDAQVERFDSVMKDECSVLSEECKLRFSQVSLPIGNTANEHSESAMVQVAGDTEMEVDDLSGGEYETTGRAPGDIATRHSDGTQDANAPTDVSRATGSNNQNVMHGNEVPVSAGGGELPPPGRADVNSPRTVSFEVKTDIFLDSTLAMNSTSKNTNAYQNIQVNGSLSFQAPDNMPFVSVKFTNLDFQSLQNASSGYNHRGVRVDVNCGCKYTTINVHQPLATKATDGKAKMTIGNKSTNTGTATGGIQAAGPTGTVAFARAREVSDVEEVVHILSRIRQHHRDGLVWWYYDVDDANDKNGGLRLNENTLPFTDFHLLSTSPDPMPSVMQISVGSFWSLQSSTKSNLFQSFFHPKNPPRSPRHMNLYERILLEIPSDLAADSAYMETVRLYPDIVVPVIELPGDVYVRSLVAHVKSLGKNGIIPPESYIVAHEKMTNVPDDNH